MNKIPYCKFYINLVHKNNQLETDWDNNLYEILNWKILKDNIFNTANITDYKIQWENWEHDLLKLSLVYPDHSLLVERKESNIGSWVITNFTDGEKINTINYNKGVYTGLNNSFKRFTLGEWAKICGDTADNKQLSWLKNSLFVDKKWLNKKPKTIKFYGYSTNWRYNYNEFNTSPKSGYHLTWPRSSKVYWNFQNKVVKDLVKNQYLFIFSDYIDKLGGV